MLHLMRLPRAQEIRARGRSAQRESLPLKVYRRKQICTEKRDAGACRQRIVASGIEPDALQTSMLPSAVTNVPLEEPCLNHTDQNVPNDAAEISLSPEHQDSIRVLAKELRASVDLVARIYGRELERLRLSARVTTFLPLLVSRLVRRRRAELAEAQSS
jgi:hypothetical protein